MENRNKRKVNSLLSVLVALLLIGSAARAATYQLIDGKTVSGDIVEMDDRGIIVKQADGSYTDPISWARLSQDDLRTLRENPKAAKYAEPFIEETRAERMKAAEIAIKDVPRLSRPPRGSLLMALLSTPVGLVLVLVIYLANLYVAAEVARYTSRPTAVVCVISALAPVLGPALFLYLPLAGQAKAKAPEKDWRPEDEYGTSTATAAAPVASATPTPAPAPQPVSRPPTTSMPRPQWDAAPVVPPQGTVAPEPEAPVEVYEPAPAAAAPALPPTRVFARGQYTFNRRFFETQMPGFFAMVRPDEVKDLILTVRAVRGTYDAMRISRITPTEVTVQVQKGKASEEAVVPFIEIQEVQIKHKDA
jgi:hypothetical protein